VAPLQVNDILLTVFTLGGNSISPEGADTGGEWVSAERDFKEAAVFSPLF
jgi:hypothetical protein